MERTSAGRAFPVVPPSLKPADVELRAGDVVLAQLPQTQEAAWLYDRCLRSGAIFVPIDPDWPPFLVKRAAVKISPRAVIAPEAQLPALSEVFPDAVSIALEEGPAARLRMGSNASSKDAPSAYLFTSGSTSAPKAVVHSRRSLERSASVVLDTFGWKPGERLLNLPELHTMSGLRNALVAAPMGRLEWVPAPRTARANLFDLVELIATSECNHIVAGPSLVRQLAMFAARLDRSRFRHLKAIFCTGASLSHLASAEVHRSLGVPVVNYYGLTETGGLCLSQDIDRWDPTDDSLGRPVGCDARLISPDGTVGDEGELQIRSQQLMTCYLDDAEATAQRFDGEWLRTGDVMFRDSAGRFHLRGRADLFINTRTTERIHPEEVESVIELHPQVAEAAVVGASDPNGGERLVCLVVLEDGSVGCASLCRELADFVSERLGPARAPNEILFVDQLARLPSGKLDRLGLKAALK